ncbi:uncharacterized protein LOC142501182 isoform X2 [Ascaphus truei]|uniref:uncharacterized protein LOC142501182 isoform X2 n=1 Tax=Ascaphus truei TaxID=8439 RepID=UPI003F59E8D9
MGPKGFFYIGPVPYSWEYRRWRRCTTKRSWRLPPQKPGPGSPITSREAQALLFLTAIIWESAEQIHCLKKKTTVIGICHQDRSRTMQSPGAQTKSESDVSSYSVQDSVMEQRPYACKIPVSTDKPEGTTEPSHKKILETRLKQVEKRSHSTTPVLQQATEQKRVVLKFQKSTSPLPTVKHAPFLMPKLDDVRVYERVFLEGK